MRLLHRMRLYSVRFLLHGDRGALLMQIIRQSVKCELYVLCKNKFANGGRRICGREYIAEYVCV